MAIITPLKELLAALFRFEKMPKIYIRFVLHRYFPAANEVVQRELTGSYAFGLLFQGIANREGDHSGLTGPDEESGYYDLSAPCPRTC
jgi:hypothetical protein